MIGINKEEPRLIFFRDKPIDLMSHPPLASSLQSLETSYLLLAIGRYPHALVVCGSAIESAIKAAIKASPGDYFNFKKLFEEAQKLKPSFTTLSNASIKEFREKRNDIIHYGFSPKDDEESAILLLNTGYCLIEECYKTFFQFDLLGKVEVYGGLLPDYAHHLKIAKKVYIKAREVKDLYLTYCFKSFAHKIRWGIQESIIPDWLVALKYPEKENDNVWEFKHKAEEELRWKTFNISWSFDCPVCEEVGSFICELDEDEFDLCKISLNRGFCLNCNFIIQHNCPFLADELCLEQIDKAKPKIFKEYSTGCT